MSRIAWTGLMRSLFSSMKTKLDKSFASKTIPVNSILAQMHRSRFFSNAYLEFFTMMSCCDLVCTSYGKISPTKMDNDLFYRVITSAPSRSTIVDECNNIKASNTNERSASELGKDWSSSDVTKETLIILKNYIQNFSDFGDLKLTNADNNEHPISSTGLVGGITNNTTIYSIGPQLSKMFVRVFSARSYDMGDDAVFGEWAYPQINRNRSAAEHCIHSLLAKDGARIIFPKLTHASLFAQTEQIIFFLNCNKLSNASSNNDIRLYFIKGINWNNRKHFISFLDKKSFIYNDDRNEETKALNKINRARLSLNAHNCIHSNHSLISYFLG